MQHENAVKACNMGLIADGKFNFGLIRCIVQYHDCIQFGGNRALPRQLVNAYKSAYNVESGEPIVWYEPIALTLFRL